MECHKLFLVMRKRHISNADFLLAVAYCQRHHKRIENAVWVFRFLAEAQQERRDVEKYRPVSDLGKEIADALAFERALSDDHSYGWIGVLSRSRGPYREEALQQWRAARL